MNIEETIRLNCTDTSVIVVNAITDIDAQLKMCNAQTFAFESIRGRNELCDHQLTDTSARGHCVT